MEQNSRRVHDSTCIFMHTCVRHDEIREMMLGNI